MDCGAINQLYAEALTHGRDTTLLEAAVADCAVDRGAGPALSAPGAPPMPPSTSLSTSLSLSAASLQALSAAPESPPAYDRCEVVREGQAHLLAMGVEDTTFLHLLAECGSSMGGTVARSGPLAGRRVTSGFGWRSHPVTGRSSFHSGIDLAARYGDAVPAVAAGVVTYAGWKGGYGRMIEVEHPVTGLRTRYAHNSELLVQVGDVVRKGQAVAEAGSSGLSTGPHVHLEVRRGDQALDPGPYLRNPDLLTAF
jgi:murein DD-endopeptidase MepM/ murein hydrolase activator NlpD